MRALAERGIDVPRESLRHRLRRYRGQPLLRAAPHDRAAARGRARAHGGEPHRRAARPHARRRRRRSPRSTFVVRESCGCPYAIRARRRPQISPTSGIPAREGRSPRGPLRRRSTARSARGGIPRALRRRAFDPAIREEALLAIAEGECRFLASQRFAAERRVRRPRRDRGFPRLLLRHRGHTQADRPRDPRARHLAAAGSASSSPRDSSPSGRSSSSSSDARGTRILAPYGLRFRSSELVPGRPARLLERLRLRAPALRRRQARLPRLHRRLDRPAHVRGPARPGLERPQGSHAHGRRARPRAEPGAQTCARAPSSSPTANARLVEEMARRKGLERELLDDLQPHHGEDRPGHPRQSLPGHRRPRHHGRGARGQAQTPRRRRRRRRTRRGPWPRAPGRRPPAPRTSRGGSTRPSSRPEASCSAVERLVAAAGGRDGTEVKLEVTERLRGPGLREGPAALQDRPGGAGQRAAALAARGDQGRPLHGPGDGHRRGERRRRRHTAAGDREEGGMGLHILKYRASVIGGELRIRSPRLGHDHHLQDTEVADGDKAEFHRRRRPSPLPPRRHDARRPGAQARVRGRGGQPSPEALALLAATGRGSRSSTFPCRARAASTWCGRSGASIPRPSSSSCRCTRRTSTASGP